MENIYQTGQYSDQNPDWHVADSPWKAAQIMRMLDKHELEPQTIAEVGCGVGEILNQLHTKLPKSVEFRGYEISPQAFNDSLKRSQDRLQFRLEDVTKSDVFFDLMLVIDVFEHVEDYIGFLRQLRSRAKHFLFHIPLDLSAQTVIREHSLLRARTEVGHLHYFTEGTALATLRDTGYQVDDYFFTARGIELGGGGIKRRIAKLPRKLVALISESLASRLLGGFSLMVLARSE